MSLDLPMWRFSPAGGMKHTRSGYRADVMDDNSFKFAKRLLMALAAALSLVLVLLLEKTA